MIKNQVRAVVTAPALWPDPTYGPPSSEHQTAADFSVCIGRKLMGHRSDPPFIMWQTMHRATKGYTVIGDGRFIYLSDDLSVAGVVETTLHELRHVGDLARVKGSDMTQPRRERAEARADEFSRFAPVVFAAGWASSPRWNPARVEVIDYGPPPDATAKTGDVVIARERMEVWERRPGRWLRVH